MQQLPRLGKHDAELILRYFVFPRRREVIDQLSALINCSLIGLSVKRATSIRTGWSLQVFRAQMDRAGIFDRLIADGVFAPYVDWSHVRAGRYVATNSYMAVSPRERVRAAFGDVLAVERDERRRELEEVSSGGGIGIRDPNVDELRNLSAQARRYVRAVHRRGGRNGNDAMAALGEDRYVESMECLVADQYEQALELCRKSPDPRHQLDAWLADHYDPRTRLLAVPIGWLRERSRWTVYGVPVSRKNDVLRFDTLMFSVDQLEHVPADLGSIRLPEKMPRMTESAPF